MLALLLLAHGMREASCQTQSRPSAARATERGRAHPPDTNQAAGTPPASNKDSAWIILTAGLNDNKHAEVRIQALAALGLLGGNPRSIRMILDTFADPDLAIRTAAVLAAGQTKSPTVTTGLRHMLDDKEPQVAFAAATALWKMHDPSGESTVNAAPVPALSAAPCTP
jgi:hypothetical protein